MTNPLSSTPSSSPARTARPWRTAAVTTALAVALTTGLSAVLAPVLAPVQAVAPAGTQPRPIGAHALSVSFDRQSATIERGARFRVSGAVATLSQTSLTAVPRTGEGVPASFTLAVTDPTGRVLGTQDVTAAGDGTFATMVPGTITDGLSDADVLRLGLRAVDATYDDHRAADAGAGSVAVRAAATGLRVENSFVSAVGWVKPGETYPSRIIVSNPTAAPVAGASVTVTAPAGTSFTNASGPGTHPFSSDTVAWTIPSVPAATGTVPGTVTLVLESRADTVAQDPTVVWRDLSTTARLSVSTGAQTVVSHGPKVIPPSDAFDTARYGDRPFPVIPVEYRDRAYTAAHTGEQLEEVINSPAKAGSTFNLYQEMSLGQLFPDGTVPSAGIATADFASYTPGFPFTQLDPTAASTCLGTTQTDTPAGTIPAPGTVGGPAYTERITNGVYNLPGTTGYYGSDGAGSAVIGSLTGIAALGQIDSGCGPTSKLVVDSAALADPEIDYSDYDTDKDGVVDFFMAVFAGCGGNGASQLGLCSDDPQDALPYDNVWPHSSSLEYYYNDSKTGLPGFTTDDQLKDLEGRPLWYTDTTYKDMTTTDKGDALKVFVRVGPYNLNPETAIDKASVISHEYGHSLGLPDFYSVGGRETYGDWNLMATDKSQNMDAFSRQELGWVVPQVLRAGETRTVAGWTDSKQDTGTITWQRPDGTPYTLANGPDGVVHNSLMYVARLPGRQLIDPAKFDTGDKATKTHAWFSGSGNDFGCANDGGGHNLDVAIPGIKDLPAGSTLRLDLKSLFDIEWDFDYGFVLTSKDGGKSFASHASLRDTPTTTPMTSNPNQSSCQAAYGNGITGSSGSYTDPVTVQLDRTTGNYPDSAFVADSFDISDLVGAATPVLRFSYATDPGLARPGWFIDDLKVTATTPSGEKVLLQTDLEKDGGPSDPRIFNGGCQADNPGRDCTKGWQFVNAGDEAAFDHGYYLEMRDRSGFDLDGHGQIDRTPIGFEPGLYLAYTDEAHGYGNAGTDSPPAQSPLDSTPEPGNDTPNLNDAAFTAATARSAYTDSGAGHTDNYTDPSNTTVDSRYADVANPWRFQYGCLGFQVLSMAGNSNGPATSDGDLTGSVKFTMGTGCGDFDFGYTPVPAPTNTKPTARAAASSTRVETGDTVRFRGSASTDTETPNDLDYSWDFGDGGSTKDAAGAFARHTFTEPGTYAVTLLVTDPEGATDTDTVTVKVTSDAAGPGPQPGTRTTVNCDSAKVTRHGSWRNVRPTRGGSYCDNAGRGTGRDTMTLTTKGPRAEIVFGRSVHGGKAALFVDGTQVGTISFHNKNASPVLGYHKLLRGLGSGRHHLRLVVLKGRAYVDRFRF
ncbi:PKD domain-containing protein [Nocardioides sp.]|uniref:PKD domain-containing protein n=1 Tax=Nocardioides sp. TaxID=35761 RepID=UPI00260A4B42|nr:PKD domain-containing protein [Nocardioides sp.]MDI6910147.1 PKD domain-containing protein [Nocardioides sp.]